MLMARRAHHFWPGPLGMAAGVPLSSFSLGFSVEGERGRHCALVDRQAQGGTSCPRGAAEPARHAPWHAHIGLINIITADRFRYLIRITTYGTPNMNKRARALSAGFIYPSARSYVDTAQAPRGPKP